MSSADSVRWSRRQVLGGALAASVAVAGALEIRRRSGPRERVLGLKVPTYDTPIEELTRQLREGLDAFPATLAAARGATVVLKPNLVEVLPGRPINTEPRLIAAAAAAFLDAGAKRVRVAEGPGHVRDIERLLELTGLEEHLRPLGVDFVDLNTDEAMAATLVANLTKLGVLPIAATILRADLVVSMPKMKTHHWAGATLSMKNLFGTVPGTEFGWPKNPLHWAGIPNSITDLWSTVKPGFAIVDGVVGMEGDGPIRGTAVNHGVVLMGDHLPAVDATAARLMGLLPERIAYLKLARGLGGVIDALHIERAGDVLEARDYQVLPEFANLRA